MPSTLAGFAVPVILQPLNRIATKHYTKRQLDVMAARDNKAHVVTEALHGIRQIKFSATEKQWEKRILDAREQELKAQWSVYVWAIFLTFIWIAMPALIGATALSVYAWHEQQIKASLAFTALSVFSSLEWTISAVPTTLTEMLDARVSTNRIHYHLKSEEGLPVQKPGSSVELENVSIAWPSRFDVILRDLNLRFPIGALRYCQLQQEEPQPADDS
jgi:ABC-type multidrug transport system fused ATPase/permease subunit